MCVTLIIVKLSVKEKVKVNVFEYNDTAQCSGECSGIGQVWGVESLVLSAHLENINGLLDVGLSF